MKTYDQRQLIVTLKRSEQAQLLLRFLKNNRVRLKNLHITDKQISFLMAKNELPIFREGRKKYEVKANIRYMQPDKILRRDALTVIGLLCMLCMPLVGLQFIWDIKVQSPIVEVEDELTVYLQEELQLRTPLKKREMPDDTALRQAIMQQFRAFSWVHIAKFGSRITITPVFAPKTEVERNEQLPLYLIASNNGVITHMDIEYGERKVKPNTTVYKGDLLVSGIIGEGEEQVVIGAKGAVYADYWLETTFTVPRVVHYDKVTEQLWQYMWNVDVLRQAVAKRSIMPLREFIVLEKQLKTERVTEYLQPEHVEARLMPLLHEKILRNLPQKSSIKSENLLHVTFDDDTVKGKVLFFVNENIAMPDHAGRGE